jgi:hypothetical protein
MLFYINKEASAVIWTFFVLVMLYLVGLNIKGQLSQTISRLL